MTNSTHHIMTRLKTRAAGIGIVEVSDAVTERQPQLTPSPSMADVLSNCLGANKQGYDAQPK